MQKVVILLFSIFTFPTVVFSQDVSVEKSLWGAQVGIFPLSVYNEVKIIDELSLRSEIGLFFHWSTASYTGNSMAWAVVPSALVEPRYYYNLNRRNNKSKRIDGNSGNYFSLLFIYTSDLFISNSNFISYPSVSLLPMYGLRRKLGSNFNYEFAFGLGRKWTYKQFDYYDFPQERVLTHKYTESGSLFGIRLAVGYVF